jgi:hypothetical protein
MLLLLFLSSISSSSLPNFNQFTIPDGFSERDLDDPLIADSHDFVRKLLPTFLNETKGRFPIELLRAWKSTGDFGIRLKLELQRLRLRYLVSLHIPRIEKEEEKFIDQIEVLRNEVPSGEVWAPPPAPALRVAIAAMQHKFGVDVELRTVVACKQLMIGRTRAQLLLDAENDLERMLLSAVLYREFGTTEWTAYAVTRVY